MALEIRQQLKMTQQLVMTPQLQQAIKLLQLSRMELVDVIQQEMEENPALEESQDLDQDQERGQDENRVDVEGEISADLSDKPQDDRSSIDEFDWQTYLESYSMGGATSIEQPDEDDRPSFENLLTRKKSLVDHLLWQLQLSNFTDEQKAVAAEIIGNLNDDGFLQATIEDICEATGKDFPFVEDVLLWVQEFDPPGVACRSLQECLLRQVRYHGLDGTLAETILEDHIEELENRKYPAIAKALQVSLEEILSATKAISELNPRPGRDYNEEEIHYITPDIFVHKLGEEYVVVLNDEGLPSLRVNSFYRSALSSESNIDAKAGEYIQEKMRSALWLIKSIHQRQRTIYRVTKSIVKFQREFFDRGIEHLRPLVLRDIAEDIEMHESTISRVTTNKYVQTPQGLFELKFFFNSGISTTDGDSVASESVKRKIKEVISNEDPRKPHSDQKIVAILKQHEITIARRTVTKYREMLGIGSSTERKRLF